MASLKSDIAEKSGEAASSASSSGGSIDYGEYSMLIITKFIQVIGAALILIVVYFIVRYIRKRFIKIEAAHEQQKTALNLLEKITTGFIIVIGITSALKVIGLDMSLLVSVGLLGLSYGLKDAIKNYIAGILIFLKSPFKIGDIVKIKKFTGKVEKMELQSTGLKTFDNKEVTIYNSDIMTKSIENYSRYPFRRMKIDISVGYGTDIEKALRIFDAILTNNPSVLKIPKYSIVFKKFGENSVIVQLRFWIKMPSNMLAVRSALAWEIHQAFDEASIFSPYSKGFEAESDYALNADRQGRIKAFYSKGIFNAPAPGGAAVQPAAGAVEILDEDEPSIEEDL